MLLVPPFASATQLVAVVLIDARHVAAAAAADVGTNAAGRTVLLHANIPPVDEFLLSSHESRKEAAALCSRNLSAQNRDRDRAASPSFLSPPSPLVQPYFPFIALHHYIQRSQESLQLPVVISNGTCRILYFVVRYIWRA